MHNALFSDSPKILQDYSIIGEDHSTMFCSGARTTFCDKDILQTERKNRQHEYHRPCSSFLFDGISKDRGKKMAIDSHFGCPLDGRKLERAEMRIRNTGH
jgi:hypothetical protein